MASADLGGGLVLMLRGNETTDGVGAAFLELLQSRVPVQWHEFRYETPAELVCDIAGSVRNCGLATYVGAHGGNAYPVYFSGTRFYLGALVNSDTPDIHVKDLDGDNRVDAYALQNDYQPAYANGHVQWQTLRRSADARSWTSTGCGPKSANHTPPEPNGLLTGPCSFS